MSTKNAKSAKRLVVAAAGTGGHVMPGLAVARAMRARGWTIDWVGTTTGMEAGLVAKDAIPFTGLDFQGVRGRGLKGALKGALKLVGAFFAARRVLVRLAPAAVFSTGGYVAVPVGWAAKSLGIPLVLMNCDADLLMSTKLLLPACRRLACGFPGGALAYAGGKGAATGNPVRADIAALPDPETRLAGRSGPLKLFVFGGSLGAKILNDVLPEALAKLPENARPQVLHQTGRGRDAEVRAHYERLGVAAEVVPFIDDMAARYAESDLVLCRAGATSASELCAAGAASVLVPFVARTTAHQRGNAHWMRDAGAALTFEQKDFTAEAAADMLAGMTRGRILELARAARGAARPDAAERVADLIEEAL